MACQSVGGGRARVREIQEDVEENASEHRGVRLGIEDGG